MVYKIRWKYPNGQIIIDDAEFSSKRAAKDYAEGTGLGSSIRRVVSRKGSQMRRVPTGTTYKIFNTQGAKIRRTNAGYRKRAEDELAKRRAKYAKRHSAKKKRGLFGRGKRK